MLNIPNYLFLKKQRDRHKPNICSNLGLIQLFFIILLRSRQSMANNASFRTFHQSAEKITHKCIYNEPKIREVYISPQKDLAFQTKEALPINTSPGKFIKNDIKGQEILPPRPVPFRRSSKNSKDKIEIIRQQSRSKTKLNDSDNIQQIRQKCSTLSKKLNAEVLEKEKWKSVSNSCQIKINNLVEENNRINSDKRLLESQVTVTKNHLISCENNLRKAHDTIQQLNKSIKQNKISQKSLNNLKIIQAQLDALQEKNRNLLAENAELTKINKSIQNQLDRRKDSTSESSQLNTSIQDEKIKSLQIEVNILKEELQKDKSERQRFLEINFRELQKKLYDKENQIKKITIQLNILDRKKFMSIDEVKSKKDQEIKDLRQRFIKVSKDLKETKDKIEKSEKKRTPKQRKETGVRKIKSSKLLGIASQSEQVTFELSSET